MRKWLHEISYTIEQDTTRIHLTWQEQSISRCRWLILRQLLWFTANRHSIKKSMSLFISTKHNLWRCSVCTEALDMASRVSSLLRFQKQLILSRMGLLFIFPYRCPRKHLRHNSFWAPLRFQKLCCLAELFLWEALPFPSSLRTRGRIFVIADLPDYRCDPHHP